MSNIQPNSYEWLRRKFDEISGKALPYVKLDLGGEGESLPANGSIPVSFPTGVSIALNNSTLLVYSTGTTVNANINQPLQTYVTGQTVNANINQSVLTYQTGTTVNVTSITTPIQSYFTGSVSVSSVTPNQVYTTGNLPVNVTNNTLAIYYATGINTPNLTTSEYKQIGIDAGGRTRVSQFTTLADFKILNSDKSLLWDIASTGSGTFQSNKYNMSVNAGQFFIRQSIQFFPYFAGKSQAFEFTFDGFGIQSGVTKRVGYFSTSTGTPFNTNIDGIFLENDGLTIRLRVVNLGVDTFNVPITSWNNYSKIASYNWNNFTVCFIDFLYLGGATLRLWLKTADGFILCHMLNYAGEGTGTFINSPNQPLRYEIRGVTQSGSFRYICAQVATEGSINESGLSRSVNTGSTAISIATIGTKYPIKAVRKLYSNRDIAVSMEDLQIFVTSTTDVLLWTLEINPTLSAPLTYTAVPNSAVEEANGNGTITVTSAGTVIASGILTQNSILNSGVLKQSYLSWLGGKINGVMDEVVLCGTPVTTTISLLGMLQYKEF